jgi:hypothetical protein
MTTQEQKTVNAIGLKQVEMETNQHYMSKDLQEMKDDIKEIKAMLIQANDLYVSKKFVKYLTGLMVTIVGLMLAIYHEFKG